MLLRVAPGALADTAAAPVPEVEEATEVAGKVGAVMGVVMGVVFAVKPGGGGGRVELLLLLELLAIEVLGAEPDIAES